MIVDKLLPEADQAIVEILRIYEWGAYATFSFLLYIGFLIAYDRFRRPRGPPR